MTAGHADCEGVGGGGGRVADGRLLLELLGHPCEWAYITAVNLTQSTDVEAKCAGYLACAALLPAGHELVLLTVNAIARDLESASPVVAHAALGAAARMLPAEAVGQMLPRVRAPPPARPTPGRARWR